MPINRSGLSFRSMSAQMHIEYTDADTDMDRKHTDWSLLKGYHWQIPESQYEDDQSIHFIYICKSFL